MSQPVQEKFLNSGYSDYFEIKSARVVLGPTSFGKQKGIRIDRIMEVTIKENSPDVHRNLYRTIKVECAYKYGDADMHGNKSMTR